MTDLTQDDHTHDDPDIAEDMQPEEAAVTVEDDHASPAPVASDLDPELEQEIKRIEVVEEPIKSMKAQMISEALIHKELGPDDLFDPGSI